MDKNLKYNLFHCILVLKFNFVEFKYYYIWNNRLQDIIIMECGVGTKNPQMQLNRNSFLIFGTHPTFHDYNIL